MYPSLDGLPQPLSNREALDDLDALATSGDISETPFNVFIGHNLGHRVFTMSVPFRQFHEISDVANDRETGPVAQRPLDKNHARNLAKYMLKGLVSAALMRRHVQGKDALPAIDRILEKLGNQPYFSLQPVVCNVRNIPYGGNGQGGIRGIRLQAEGTGETAAFKVFLSERHVLWVIDGQHRRAGADMVMSFLQDIRQSGRYPAKAPVLYPDKGQDISSDEMQVWNETYEAARSYATLTLEVHLGLDIDQEKQLFHDLNKLGKRVSSSMALQFDSSNPITQFIKSSLADGLVRVTDADPRDWSQDEGEVAMKDMVAITSLAFLNKSNSSGATPAVTEPRQPVVEQLWHQIAQIPGFGEKRAKEKTIAAQPVVLKALAKLTYDLNFSNRKPANGDQLFEQLMQRIEQIDFSHSNPVWRYYELNDAEVERFGLQDLKDWLPDSDGTANRDIGAYQNGHMRFGAKHNDIFPIIADMIRFQAGLPSRKS